MTIPTRPGRGALLRDATALLLLLPFVLVPLVTTNQFYYSLTNQVLIGIMAALSVYIMLRMDLLSFAVPAFMAIGGYTAAIAAKAGTTDVMVLSILSFAVPALVALPLGALVLRLKGVYFVLVTFVFNEILQLAIFETPALTGGSNGIAGVPSVTLWGSDLGSNRMLVFVTLGLALLAAAITLAITHRYRAEFASIEENETLGESLGLVIWRYRTAGFVVAAGVAGLAGFALVNMLLTAHPSSFSSFSSVNYIAYAIVGGRGALLGPVLGGTLLVSTSNLFSSQGEYSAGLFGLLIIGVVTLAPGGLVGTGVKWWRAATRRANARPGARASAGAPPQLKSGG
ncbi:ABC-type transporter, integral membrane subunit [Delftia sp. Cs1-4]|uniref:branched-chain amino acid ABC transporter permease n=1 Tax=Delftia sp. (strain Cs1-4) TaxID=742013 RepID=UPI00020E7D20|nr:branched-chain amino acid ABC transporter permease [Delftia sp. Cs1-4]AEF88664.1 ABC-type transporter, integral membrane subunit [Delftia sp. Cs1-4]